jgi:apolipoprotein N-acyltransferase
VRYLALPRGDWPLIVGGAVLLCAAYPPFHLFLPSLICLVPAVWLIVDGADDPRPLRRHLVQGFWFGLLTNALTLFWMIVALWHLTPLSALGYAATITVLGVYSAGVFAVTGWVSRRTSLSLALSFPVCWTAVEWMVGHQGDLRFPWLGLGTSLTGYPTAVQIADVIGARGVTLLLVLANTVLALAWRRRRERSRAVAMAGTVGLGIVVAVAYGVLRERSLTIRPVGDVALLQPNVVFPDTWGRGQRDTIMRGLLDLSNRAIEEGDPDLVVWPEASVPGNFRQFPRLRRAIAASARTTRTPQLVGGVHLMYAEDGDYAYFNSAFLFDSLGRDDQPVYHKQYLVPVTERVPFLNPRWFKLRYFGGFAAGRERPVYEVGIGRFGVLICYESAFEDLTRYYRMHGAGFVVNITNDAWFGRTSAPYQHAAHLVMRAIENRVGIARAANSGISGFVGPLGDVSHQTGLYRQTHVTGRLTTSDTISFYARMGDWVGTVTLLLAAGLVAYAAWRRP